jgi:DNA topoisomerase II
LLIGIAQQDFMISNLEEALRRLSNKVRFILMVVNNQLKIIKRKQQELIAQLEELKFDKLPKKTKQVRSKNAVIGAEAEDRAEEMADEISVSYDYLLSMPLWSLTFEKVEELQREHKDKEHELEVLRQIPIEEMWRSDLKEFLAALADFEAGGDTKKVKASTKAVVPEPELDDDQRVTIKVSEEKPTRKRKADPDGEATRMSRCFCRCCVVCLP